MNEHTLGPWEIKERGKNETPEIRGIMSGGATCPVARILDGDIRHDAYKANALLIAAAPRLLAEVKSFDRMAANLLARETLSQEDFVSLKDALAFTAPARQAAIAAATGA